MWNTKTNSDRNNDSAADHDDKTGSEDDTKCGWEHGLEIDGYTGDKLVDDANMHSDCYDELGNGSCSGHVCDGRVLNSSSSECGEGDVSTRVVNGSGDDDDDITNADDEPDSITNAGNRGNPRYHIIHVTFVVFNSDFFVFSMYNSQ